MDRYHPPQRPPKDTNQSRNYRFTIKKSLICAELCELSNTPAASNRRLLMAQLNINRLCFQDSTCKMYKNKLMDTFNYNLLAVNVGNVIRELCLVRDNELSCELPPIEVNAIINELCINWLVLLCKHNVYIHGHFLSYDHCTVTCTLMQLWLHCIVLNVHVSYVYVECE